MKENLNKSLHSTNPSLIGDSYTENIHLKEISNEFRKIYSKEKIFVIKKIMKISTWKKAEDQLLSKLAKNFKERNWKKVAEYFQDKTAIQCSSRFKRICPKIIKGPWSNTEDENLLKLINLHGLNWSLIGKKLGNRTGKQIRDRYLNNLDPNLNKDLFSKKEDKLIIILQNKFKNSWAKIAKYFKGRTGDMIKNRFYAILKKRNAKLLKRKLKDKISEQKNEFLNEKIPIMKKGNALVKIYKKKIHPSNFSDNNLLVNNFQKINQKNIFKNLDLGKNYENNYTIKENIQWLYTNQEKNDAFDLYIKNKQNSMENNLTPLENQRFSVLDNSPKISIDSFGFKENSNLIKNDLSLYFFKNSFEIQNFEKSINFDPENLINNIKLQNNLNFGLKDKENSLVNFISCKFVNEAFEYAKNHVIDIFNATFNRNSNL